MMAMGRQRIEVLLEAEALRGSPAGRIRDKKQDAHYGKLISMVKSQYRVSNTALVGSGKFVEQQEPQSVSRHSGWPKARADYRAGPYNTRIGTAANNGIRPGYPIVLSRREGRTFA